ncbi:MAG: rhomboid family intramembrane serine protease [Proteobacteria bacterium]|nr:rhomboid family intramembrane serine protease [Pseudomonadota bacterium]
MLPLRDLSPPGHRPLLVYALIAANVLVFLGGPAAELERADFVHRWGVVPFSLIEEQHWGSWVTPLTYLFLHGDLFHLLSNVWFLYVFGSNVEDVFGRLRFALFYLACGIVAALAHVLRELGSPAAMIGASGAIAGTLGAYVRLFPAGRVLTWIPPIFVLELPAFFFIFVWFAKEVLRGYVFLHGPNTSGVAFFAHIGGFVAGLALVRVIGPKRYEKDGWISPGELGRPVT